MSIAESAVNSLKNIVTRGKELAEQSANGVYSDTQRTALDNELQALGKEYNRILDSTSFNGVDTFSRKDGQLVIQAGESTLIIAGDSSRAESVDDTQRVSQTAGGAPGYDPSFSSGRPGSVSADGRYVVYQSIAENLVQGGTTSFQILRKDLQTGTTITVSTATGGGDSNDHSYNASISADGRYVVYESDASNLVAGDTNGTTDIFRTDLQTGTTVRVSVSTGGTEGNSGSSNATISADGRYVAYRSSASNLVAGDTNGTYDIFRTDVQTGTTVRVSTATGGTQTNSDSGDAVISADGRFVVYTSNASNLVAGDTNGTSDIFRTDLQTGSMVRVSTATGGVQGNNGSFSASVSADGRYVVYSSIASNLVAGDTNGSSDVFRTDLLTGTTVRVSTATGGVQSNSNSTAASISADGRYVVYQSNADNLVADDSNGQADVFVTDIQAGTTQRAGLSKSGREASSAGGGIGDFGASISSDGKYIFFGSSASDILDGAPTNNEFQVYLTSNPLNSQSTLTHFQWVDVKSQSEAKNALTWLSSYADELDKAQGLLGANLSRLTTAGNQLGSLQLSYKTAESRITDVDIADESTKLVRSQIVQKVAASVLAQANFQPQIALQLLQN